jgi:quercetin dioxygenase-like cupin family protein
MIGLYVENNITMLKGSDYECTYQKMISTILFFLSFTFPKGQAENVSTAKREVLLESTHSWNGTDYTHYPTGVPQLTVLKLMIAPNSVLPWHTHPFPNTCYVLSGELTIHDKESAKSVTYHQGQAFAESVDRVHPLETVMQKAAQERGTLHAYHYLLRTSGTSHAHHHRKRYSRM